MSYSTVEAGVQAIIQALATYDDEDVTRGDFRLLNRGSPPYVVLTMGAFRREAGSNYATMLNYWTVNVDLFVRYLGDGTEYTDLATYAQEIVTEIDKYPTLNGVSGVVRARLWRGGEPWEKYEAGSDTPAWVVQRLVVVVKEAVKLSGGTYA